MSVHVGQRIGRLVIVERIAPLRGGDGHAKWRCKCDCGGEVTVFAANLKRTKSCGCFRREHLASVATTHGYLRGRKEHSLYRTWTGMRRRCTAVDAHNYRYYGGRGIAVCARWEDFGAFVADMGERPPSTTLDRINNDGNYEPGNCRWATRKQQRSNRRERVRKEYPISRVGA